jgi:hypothetical protein
MNYSPSRRVLQPIFKQRGLAAAKLPGFANRNTFTYRYDMTAESGGFIDSSGDRDDSVGRYPL